MNGEYLANEQKYYNSSSSIYKNGPSNSNPNSKVVSLNPSYAKFYSSDMNRNESLSNYDKTKRTQSANRNNSSSSSRLNNNNTSSSHLYNSNIYYYSANESCGEDHDYSINNNNKNNQRLLFHDKSIQRNKINYDNQIDNNKELLNKRSDKTDSKIITNNNSNLVASVVTEAIGLTMARNIQLNNNEIDSNNVSYASITLRKPLKELNYFSDSEALNYSNTSSYNNLFSSANNDRLRSKSKIRYNSSSSNSNKTNANEQQKQSELLPIYNQKETTNYNLNKNNYNNSNRRSNPQQQLNQEQYISNNSLSYPSSYNNNKNNNNLSNYNNNSNYNHHLIKQEKQEENIFLEKQKQQKELEDLYLLYLKEHQSSEQRGMLSSSLGGGVGGGGGGGSNDNNYHLYQNNFNSQPHGFSKLNSFFDRNKVISSTTSPNFNDDSSNVNNKLYKPTQFNPVNHNNVKWSPTQSTSGNFVSHSSNQQLQHQPSVSSSYDDNNYHQKSNFSQAHGSIDEDYVDPVEEKYEREMGSELAKPSKSNYSDSYFYNSSVFNYPTIEDQKKLAKTIANTLEGSNPETSKYHKKKQSIRNQFKSDGYESETQNYSHDYGSGNSTNNDDVFQQDTPIVYNSYVYDETLPDIVKRSIAKASTIDPVRLVQAPENFKKNHYTEHVSHTEMPPKVAMSLAAALETGGSGGLFKGGGRGAEIFQKRKAKAEKWVIDESNVKRPLGYQPPPTPTLPQNHYQPPSTPTPVKLTQMPSPPQPQQPIYQSENEIFFQDPHSLTQFNTNQNPNKYSDFNIKPKGWGTKIELTPNKIDMTAWNKKQENQHDQQHYIQPPSISKQGVKNLKSLLNESSHINQSRSFAAVSPSPLSQPLHINTSSNDISSYNHPHHTSSSSTSSLVKNSLLLNETQNYGHQNNESSKPQINKVKLNKLSSHENYLFNNRNALDALRSSAQFRQKQDHFYDEPIATSDL